MILFAMKMILDVNIYFYIIECHMLWDICPIKNIDVGPFAKRKQEETQKDVKSLHVAQQKRKQRNNYVCWEQSKTIPIFGQMVALADCKIEFFVNFCSS